MQWRLIHRYGFFDSYACCWPSLRKLYVKHFALFIFLGEFTGDPHGSGVSQFCSPVVHRCQTIFIKQKPYLTYFHLFVKVNVQVFNTGQRLFRMGRKGKWGHLWNWKLEDQMGTWKRSKHEQHDSDRGQIWGGTLNSTLQLLSGMHHWRLPEGKAFFPTDHLSRIFQLSLHRDNNLPLGRNINFLLKRKRFGAAHSALASGEQNHDKRREEGRFPSWAPSSCDPLFTNGLLWIKPN